MNEKNKEFSTRHSSLSIRTPAIRFKGFSGKWVAKKLKDLTETGFSNGVFNDPKKVGRGYRLINVKDMYVGNSIDVKSLSLVDIDEKEFIKNKVEYGDIFFTRSSLVKEGIAYSNVNLSEHQGLTYDGHLIRMQPCMKIAIPVFLAFLFKTSSARKQFIVGGKTTTMTTIGQSDIAEVKIAIPLLQEQTKIGSYFQQLDTLITQHQRKHDTLLNVKKAMLEKMFPKKGAEVPEIRFKGFSEKWEERKLGELAKITTGSSNRQDSGLDGEYTFFDRSEDIRASNIYLFDCEAIIVAGEGSDFVPKYFIGKFDLHQRSYAIMNFDGMSGKFLFSYIHYFRKHFLDHAVGSTVKSLRLPMFQEMSIKHPQKLEQTKIGKLFKHLDTLLSLHQTELEKLKNIKKACLEKMFV